MYDSLGDRMKGYEECYSLKLPMRMPVIVRIDGKAFHTYTANLEKPVDLNFQERMNNVAKELCKEVSGTQIAYVQSDEISLLIHTYKKLTTQAYFGNNLQKLVSVTAGIASAEITRSSVSNSIRDAIKPASFDARAFVLPEAEVCNYFIWRQQDATRNSIQSYARSLYSHSECNNKDSNELIEMIHQKGVSWNKLPSNMKRGRCVVYKDTRWLTDYDIPIFSEKRDYINNLLKVEDE